MRLFAVVVVAMSVSATLVAQKGSSLAETEKLLQQAANDPERIAAFYAGDAVMMIQDGPMLKGRQQILQQFLLPAAKATANLKSTTKTIDLSESGDLGYTVGTLEYTGPAGTLSGKYVAVWKRLQGEWKISYAIANTDPRPAK